MGSTTLKKDRGCVSRRTEVHLFPVEHIVRLDLASLQVPFERYGVDGAQNKMQVRENDAELRLSVGKFGLVVEQACLAVLEDPRGNSYVPQRRFIIVQRGLLVAGWGSDPFLLSKVVEDFFYLLHLLGRIVADRQANHNLRLKERYCDVADGRPAPLPIQVRI